MDTSNDLKKTESELKQLQEAIAGLSNLKDQEEMSKKLQQLDFDHETAIMNLLEKSDKLYDSMVQENFDLLINDRIEFKVTREESGGYKSHAITLDGRLHADGLFYGQTTETDSGWLHFYPLSYVGLINYFGEADLYMDRKKYNVFGGIVPRKFAGYINPNGGVVLEATEDFEEGPGKLFVNNIIADLFSGDLGKRERFMNNRSHLKMIISDFRNSLR